MSANARGESRKRHGLPTLKKSSELPPRIERRPSQRKRTLLRGVIAHSSGAQSFHCTIRDLTKEGARITLAATLAVPANVYLIDVRGRVAYDAKIVWNNGVEAGLVFRKSIPLADLNDPKLAYLSKLWHGAAER